ncbi:hypothetical protein AVEN_106459-1 [Araneus ventricosus]|uniref:Uncharacterized protein n=1 Tax=Araneus ventricosus TaxID=182803 RepID=A0A4Y2ASK0_ARAVE|nr:hypothetical protein AVEN_106459-1 [Araneus ventricosus]
MSTGTHWCSVITRLFFIREIITKTCVYVLKTVRFLSPRLESSGTAFIAFRHRLFCDYNSPYTANGTKESERMCCDVCASSLSSFIRHKGSRCASPMEYKGRWLRDNVPLSTCRLRRWVMD